MLSRLRAVAFIAAMLSGLAMSLSVASARPLEQETTSVRHAISWQRERTWHWQTIAGVTRSPTIRGAGAWHSIGYLHWIEHRWNGRRLAAYKIAHRPRPNYRTLASTGGIAHEALWLCIHSGYLNGRRVSVGEGSWSDTGDPYWGGLQMHPGWGYGTSYHASDDSPAVQMRAAENGYHASGYSQAWLDGQWPNTAPPCLSLA